MNPFDEFKQNITRRHFFAKGRTCSATAALASLMRGQIGGQIADAAGT